MNASSDSSDVWLAFVAGGGRAAKQTERNRKKQKHVDGCDGAGPIARVKRKEGNNGPGR